MKTRTTLCGLLSLLFIVASSSVSHAETFGKFTYRVIGTSIEITDYSDDATGDVVIPDTIEGKPVIRIGDWAFSDYGLLSYVGWSITIPDSVTSIGYGAFSFSSLTSVTIPASVTSIGGSAFEGCSSLTSVIIPDKVTSIGVNAFSGCSKLASITIPDSVTSIGNSAFSGCTALASVTIGNNVTSIGHDDYGFQDYNIGSVFYGCSSLTSINVAAANSNYSSLDGVLFNKDQTTLLKCPEGFAGSFTIPDSVTSIGYGAFLNCTGLTSATIPDSVTSIGGGAFSGCAGLTSITIPDKVTSIGYNTFQDCFSLTSITIPDKVTSIGAQAFGSCFSLTDITIGNSVTSIGYNAFYDCFSLTAAIFLGDAPTSFGNDVFAVVGTGFTIYYIPGSNGFTPTSWNGYKTAFLFEYNTIKGATEIEITGVLEKKVAGSLSIPATIEGKPVTSIGVNAFFSCSGLTSVTIPASVTSIGGSAFSNCSGLTSVIFLGDAPVNFGSAVFFEAADGFTVYYLSSSSGFTSPTWNSYPTQALFLSLSAETQSVTSQGGTNTVEVTSNMSWSWTSDTTTGDTGDDWPGDTGYSWLTSEEDSDQSGYRNFSYTVAENTSTSPRTGTITFTAGSITKTLTVTQDGVATTSIYPSGESAGPGEKRYNIDVTSNTNWTATSNKPWATVSPDSGSGNGTVTVTVAVNDTGEFRAAIITIGGQEHQLEQSRISDNDDDGVPDSTDPDDDNDGVSDVDEAALGTDPLVNNQTLFDNIRNSPGIFGHYTDADILTVEAHQLGGRIVDGKLQLELDLYSSEDLNQWDYHNTIQHQVPVDGTQRFFRFQFGGQGQ